MGRYGKPRFGVEFLERKLNLSTSLTGAVAAQVSAGPVPEVPTTVATVAPAPGVSAATVGATRSGAAGATTAIHPLAQNLAGPALSAHDSAADDQDPPGDPGTDPPPPPTDPTGPTSGSSASGSGAGGSSGSAGGSSSAGSRGSQTSSASSNDAMVRGSGASAPGGGIYVASGAIVLTGPS
jgi:hypothetical protein